MTPQNKNSYESGEVAEKAQNSNNNNNKVQSPRLKTRKNDLIVWLSITPQQYQMYDEFLSSSEVKNVSRKKKSNICFGHFFVVLFDCV